MSQPDSCLPESVPVGALFPRSYSGKYVSFKLSLLGRQICISRKLSTGTGLKELIFQSHNEIINETYF